MLSPLLFELFYETHVVFIEKSDVVDSVTTHCRSLYTDTECRSAVFFGIDTAILEDLRMNHTCTQYLDPAFTLTYTATLTAA